MLSILRIIVVSGLTGEPYYLVAKNAHVVFNKKSTTAIIPAKELTIVRIIFVSPNPSTINVLMFSRTNDGDYELQDKNYISLSLHCYLDLSSPDVIAFNSSLYIQYKHAHPVNGVCTMIRAFNANSTKYKNQCISNIYQRLL